MLQPIQQPGTSPKLQRLIDQVERLQLHVACDLASPRAWLVEWLGTPQEELNGQRPSRFLLHEDFDLILVGMLIKARTAQG